MMDHRTVILGMNNPHSLDPRHALAPYPSGVAGHRLWRMLHDVAGTSRAAYMRGFDRRNVLQARKWNASEVDRKIWETLRGRRVLVLGQTLVNVLHLTRRAPLVWSEEEGVRWCEVPHPSGLNRWYNDELHRVVVGLRLEEEFARGAVGV